MKSRAFVRNRIFQAVKRNESIFVTDPKSELYEDMAICAKWDIQSEPNLSGVVKLMPLAVIAVLGLTLVMIEFYRWRKSR